MNPCIVTFESQNFVGLPNRRYYDIKCVLRTVGSTFLIKPRRQRAFFRCLKTEYFYWDKNCICIIALYAVVDLIQSQIATLTFLYIAAGDSSVYYCGFAGCCPAYRSHRLVAHLEGNSKIGF
jgi:hypothetical protein